MKPEESFVGQPIRALQTMLRAIAQFDETQPNVIPDGIYGQQTRQAITAFQRNNGLSPTGVTDQDTWEAVVEAYRPAQVELATAEPIYITMNPGKIFVRGDRHPHITLVQAMLLTLSQAYTTLPTIQVTGILDDQTAQGLMYLQHLSDLPVTGNLDKLTWKHIVRHYGLAFDRISRKSTEV